MSDPIAKQWQTDYDTAWAPEDTDRRAIPSGMTENCIRSPEQIRKDAVTDRL